MPEKKELSLDELENVNGGYITHKYLPEGTYGDLIGPYDAPNYINRNVWVVCTRFRREYCWGKLLESNETSDGWDEMFGTSTRYQKVDVQWVNGTWIHAGIHEFPVYKERSDYDLFLKID